MVWKISIAKLLQQSDFYHCKKWEVSRIRQSLSENRI